MDDVNGGKGMIQNKNWLAKSDKYEMDVKGFEAQTQARLQAHTL